MILLDTNISGIPDTLIAATALVFDLELLTYNRNVESAQRFSVYTHFTSKQWIWINARTSRSRFKILTDREDKNQT